MRQTFRVKRPYVGSGLLGRKDLAKMLRRMADLLDEHADFYRNDPDHCAGETDATPPRFEVFATIRKDDIYPATITVQEFRPK
jgi:hypothetical protein